MSLQSACALALSLDISLDWLLLGKGAIDGHRTAVEPCVDTSLTRADIARFHAVSEAMSEVVIQGFLNLAEAVVDRDHRTPLRSAQPKRF